MQRLAYVHGLDGPKNRRRGWFPPAPASRVRFGAYALVQTLTVFIAVSASVLVL